MGAEIAKALISKLTPISSGKAYDEAVQAGTAYWASVLAGRTDEAAKAEADRALSNLLGYVADVSGRKLGLIERIRRAIK